jgi:hypothetical protein
LTCPTCFSIPFKKYFAVIRRSSFKCRLISSTHKDKLISYSCRVFLYKA